MYISAENKQKLFLSCAITTLAGMTALAGKTVANTIILTSYPSTILPYFYFFQGILIILLSTTIAKAQLKNPQRTTFIYKIAFLVTLLLLFLGIVYKVPSMQFIAAILLFPTTSIVVLIAWSYVADIYDLQAFKRYYKILQTSSTLGCILSGAIVSIITSRFNILYNLDFIIVIEAISLFFFAAIQRFLPIYAQVPRQMQATASIRQVPIFKYLAVIVAASIILTLLIDYDLKLTLLQHVKKEDIGNVINLLFVISITVTLVIQLFFLDHVLNLVGSKKIIITYPIIVLLAVLPNFLPFFNYLDIALLFVINDIISQTTLRIGKNLNLNILPRATRLISQLSLNGWISALASTIAALTIFVLGHFHQSNLLSMILVLLLALGILYFTQLLSREYIDQLKESLSLRQFSREFIQTARIDKQDIEVLFKEGLSNKDVDTKLFALGILASQKDLELPQFLGTLLLEHDSQMTILVSRILAERPDQKQFIGHAREAIFLSRDDETRWNLLLYLIPNEQNKLLSWEPKLLDEKSNCSMAMLYLLYLYFGDINQNIHALQALNKMYQAKDLELNRWFLYLIKEIHLSQKENYLQSYIAHNDSTLQIEAIRQIPSQPMYSTIDALILQIGNKHILKTLNTCLVQIGDRILEPLELKFNNTRSYPVKITCLQIISNISTLNAEMCCIRILSLQRDVYIKNSLAKYLAFKGVKTRISDDLKSILSEQLKIECELYQQLMRYSHHHTNPIIKVELDSRIYFLKQRVLYYMTAIIGSVDVLNSLYLFFTTKVDEHQQGIALELIDSMTLNRELTTLMMTFFVEVDVSQLSNSEPVNDPWLNSFIHQVESNHMESIYTLTRLRKVSIFKNLAAESLQVLADCCISKDMAKGEIIFREGDPGDGLYIIDSGEVSVSKNGIVIDTLKETSYFGELALLSEIPRFATVTALSDGALFYIDKQDFDRITDELPEIMKSINAQIIQYLFRNVKLIAE
jgi:hypothetical protein